MTPLRGKFANGKEKEMLEVFKAKKVLILLINTKQNIKRELSPALSALIVIVIG